MNLLRIHLEPAITGQPPWYTASSLEPSEWRPNQKAAAPLVGQSRSGLLLAKNVVAPPALVSDSHAIRVEAMSPVWRR